MTLTAERLRELLDYEPETGVFRWAVDRGPGRPRVGDAAGSADATKDGRIIIKIAGRKHKAHRLAWLSVTGAWPVGEIDHRDGNPANNAWANLREATRAENARNSKRPAHNRSGFKGVRPKPNGRWEAFITKDSRWITLGRFPTAEEAHAAYVAAAHEHHGEFARPA
jgi:hypothetical protein